MKNIIIFGQPGTDKEIISKKISQEYDLNHISIKDIIEKNKKEKTKIGILSNKMFLPDNVINEMIKKEVIKNKNSNGIIFSGFPRTISQAKMINQLLFLKKTPISKVIQLDCDKWLAIDKINKTNNEKYKNSETFEAKWNIYKTESTTILNYFKELNLVEKIDASNDIDVVYNDVKLIIKDI